MMAQPPLPLPRELREREARIMELVEKLRALDVPEDRLRPVIDFARPTR